MDTVNKHDLTALRSIQLAAEPIPSLFGDDAARHNECVVDKHISVCLWIKYNVP
jgi:hypothetical protein